MAARRFAATSLPTTNRADLLRLAVQMAELKERIGGRMRELREERQRDDPQWTQEYVARLIEPMLNGTQVSRWERGENRPGDERLERIAEIYETTVADLYAGPMADRETQGPTPDVLGTLNGDPTQLDRIEAMLRSIREYLGIEEEKEEPAPAPTFAGRLSARDDAEAPTDDEQAQQEAAEPGTAEEGR